MLKTNLLPETHRARNTTRRIRRGWAVAVALSAVAAGGAVVSGLLRTGPAVGTDDAEQIAVAERRASASRDEAVFLGRQLAANRQASSAVDAVVGQPDWQALLTLISAELGDQSVLTRCRFGTDRDSDIRQAVGLASEPEDSAWLVLGGVAQAYPEVSALVLRLESLGLFSRVTLVETWSEPFAGEARTGFRVACKIR